ncbi:MAG TPA: hypothetical protein VLQ52_04230 [Coriobacteriia bacterium]|nr:hypothetical protein [Coriobacteriia bacterium]
MRDALPWVVEAADPGEAAMDPNVWLDLRIVGRLTAVVTAAGGVTR